MTNDECTQLIEFPGRKFDETDRHFERVDARFDEVATQEEVRTQQAETRRHFEIVAEGLRSQIKQVAEGVVDLDQKLERFRGEVEAEFQEVKSMFRFSYAELDRWIRSLEEGMSSLQERVARVESRRA